jgi:putative addiction module component (TIGR02574 family)
MNFLILPFSVAGAVGFGKTKPSLMRLAELDNEDWLDDEEPLTIHEKALLEARLAAYAKDPDVGSTWEEVEGESEPPQSPAK